MRYTPDVINAENWNTGLKKTGLDPNQDPDENAEQPQKTIPKSGHQTAGKSKQISNTDLIRTAKINPSPTNLRASRNKTNKRKKRELFFLSGLLTGLFPRSRHRK